MIGRRAVIGLSLLSALLVCAFAAQSASALVVTKSTNTTMVTCVPVVGTGGFEDAHCDKKDAEGNGNYAHSTSGISANTEIDGTNQKVANGTLDHVPALLKGTVALAKVEIECTKVKNIAANSKVSNTEPKGGEHTFSGKIETQFSECNVKKLAKCIVSEPIISNANVHGVQGFKGPKGEANAMGIEFEGIGAEKLFASITFTNKGAEACSLHNKTFPVTGNVIATNGPTAESKQDNTHSGSTLTFQDKTGEVEMQTLKMGPNDADFTAIATPTMASGGNPISMTTTT